MIGCRIDQLDGLGHFLFDREKFSRGWPGTWLPGETRVNGSQLAKMEKSIPYVTAMKCIG